MRPSRFPSLGLRDPAFLQGSGLPPAPITTADADTDMWYKAVDHIRQPDYWGDKMDTTTSKVSTAAPNMNFWYNSPGRFQWLPYIGADNRANLIRGGEVINDGASNAWQVHNVTKDSATTCTFTAQNGYIRQDCYWLEDSWVTYVFRFLCRNISGNTNLTVMHTGSQSGDTTPVTIDGVLTEYKIEFLGPAAPTLAFACGIQDTNAAGHGQIEFTGMQVYRKNEHETTYLPSAAQAYVENPRRDNVPCVAMGLNNASSCFRNLNANRPSGNGPMTIYFACWFRQLDCGPSGYTMLTSAPTFYRPIMGVDPADNAMRIYQPSTWVKGTPVVTPRQWVVLTYVLNGASSEVRYNADPGDTIICPATPVMDTYQIGNTSSNAAYSKVDFHEIIIRHVADNTAKQNEFIAYLMGQVGI